MINKLIKFGLILVSSAVFLPLAYLGVNHGSSYGLEAGAFMLISCIIINISIIKAK